MNGTNLAAALATKIIGYLAQGYDIDGENGRMMLKKNDDPTDTIFLHVDTQ